MKKFKSICRMDKVTLKKWLAKFLATKYKEVINGDGFLYAEGDGKTPILLTAHMDTVHKERCKEIITKTVNKQHIMTSPQGIGGDDRCGIWLIYMVLTKTKYRPSILFCEDEEIGGVGSSKFVKTEYVRRLTDLKYLVELDRANSKDAVYYDCGNLKFQKYIKETIGYTKEYGSFSDISHLSPACDKASVNLSCGYYRQHTLEEYVVYEEMCATYQAVKVLLKDSADCDSYDYCEEKWGFDNVGYNYYPSNSLYDQYYKDETYYEIHFNNTKTGKEDIYATTALTEYEALGMLMYDFPFICYDNVIEVYEY